MNLEIIRATGENATEMGFIHSYSCKKAYKGIIPDNIIDEFTSEKRAEIFHNVIPKAEEEYYLFKVDSIPAGFASLNKSHEENAPKYIGEIYSIYFHPDFWGTPVTKKGLQFCIDRLRNLGYSYITIWVLKDNTRAIKFYKKNGFTCDDFEKEIYIGKKLLEIRYSKKIQ
ncbi:TPA: GNAT family N-acetyltransferase [Clostridioides difficile]|uniref:GNAT family N-acetyltransferase n=1 Tax=Clostridioides difficile TaxID=1496 RepID=UPI0010B89D0C|nr:GNAT family N-acetyltransferase [Clostridioides difficile]MBY2436337.1 GNAT family N-acetyltransferase [Clostridioides difficile]MCP8652508.1 GNAT family N-acetyltransferase [Clostridioides difficile]MDM0193118.1 GNAT family N-acetyltransferase [Clostridioides difficile]VIB63759.1 gcn5-related n-acetyltransferase; gcn5-related n-acetyltransferase [Clostridioides difficile]HBE9528915.1 GNAT family N-acetyltransferase [Clostridioides difficile]